MGQEFGLDRQPVAFSLSDRLAELDGEAMLACIRVAAEETHAGGLVRGPEGRNAPRES